MVCDLRLHGGRGGPPGHSARLLHLLNSTASGDLVFYIQPPSTFVFTPIESKLTEQELGQLRSGEVAPGQIEPSLRVSSIWWALGGLARQAGGSPRRYRRPVAAKEKLRQAIDELSEAEAQDALGYIARRRGARDPVMELLDNAPIDDEPTTLEEEEGVRVAKAEIERGEVFSAEEIKRELG